MEKIKGYSDFTNSEWEKFCMDFLNSIIPNPFEVLGNLDDISLEYQDMGYSFYPWAILYNKEDDWKCDILFSEIGANMWNDGEQNAMINYSPDLPNARNLAKYIKSDKYEIVYKFAFYPKIKDQKFGDMLDEFFDPFMERVENEYSLTILESFVMWAFNETSGRTTTRLSYSSGFPKNVTSGSRENKFDYFMLGTKLG
jgi:hypothetical protein